MFIKKADYLDLVDRINSCQIRCSNIEDSMKTIELKGIETRNRVDSVIKYFSLVPRCGKWYEYITTKLEQRSNPGFLCRMFGCGG